jgi:hypothetical protein
VFKFSYKIRKIEIKFDIMGGAAKRSHIMFTLYLRHHELGIFKKRKENIRRYVLPLYKNHESGKIMAELTIATMHFALPSLEKAEQYCTHSTQFASCLFTQCLGFKVAFTISTPFYE